MRKIPTLFARDPDDPSRVTRDVTPGCEWVTAGEGVATRKYDGTCVMLDGDGQWWARREVKPGKATPAHFVAVEADPVTGKTVGWEPVEQSAFARWHAEAVAGHPEYAPPLVPGTYELCGPKVNGNPEGFEAHVLVLHAEAERVDYGRTFDELAAHLNGVEGIVWHHPDGRMAKVKCRDFGVRRG